MPVSVLPLFILYIFVTKLETSSPKLRVVFYERPLSKNLWQIFVSQLQLLFLFPLVNMDAWDCAQVKSYLISQNFNKNLATILERKEIDGTALKAIGQQETLKDMAELLELQPGKLILLRY